MDKELSTTLFAKLEGDWLHVLERHEDYIIVDFKGNDLRLDIEDVEFEEITG